MTETISADPVDAAAEQQEEPLPRLSAIHSARETGEEGCLILEISAYSNTGQLIENFPFFLVPDDEHGLAPLIRSEMANPMLIAGAYEVLPFQPSG